MRHIRTALGVLLWIAVARAQTGANPGGVAAAPKAKTAAVIGVDWTGRGGKDRDFIVSTSGLADSWAVSGPKKLWTRPLGDGYSAIAEEGGVLYTVFRRQLSDVITALALWEYEYLNPFTNDFSEKVGPGPYAMPQVTR